MNLYGALNLVFVTDFMSTAVVLTMIMLIVRVPTEYGFISMVGTEFFVRTVAPTDYCASGCGEFPC